MWKKYDTAGQTTDDDIIWRRKDAMFMPGNYARIQKHVVTLSSRVCLVTYSTVYS